MKSFLQSAEDVYVFDDLAGIFSWSVADAEQFEILLETQEPGSDSSLSGLTKSEQVYLLLFIAAERGEL